ncbi:DUF4304 domain-containing protein [Aeromicrobium wangtongii]|uniref:DUF4304 domain-containing protein n=1 Tax=Aeromicrobium wangtongii TaxID=2969247 RepID=UPI001E652D68|nr:DUF4304 domain-containing protein [Aeromicrobium wangtongii]
MEDFLSPALRDRDFKGSSGIYELPSASHWKRLSLQKSLYNDRDEIAFAANLLVVRRDLWDEMRARESMQHSVPRPGTLYNDPVEFMRLAPADDSDHWWQVSPRTDAASLAKDFMDLLDRFGIPWLDAKSA